MAATDDEALQGEVSGELRRQVGDELEARQLLHPVHLRQDSGDIALESGHLAVVGAYVRGFRELAARLTQETPLLRQVGERERSAVVVSCAGEQGVELRGAVPFHGARHDPPGQ